MHHRKASLTTIASLAKDRVMKRLAIAGVVPALLSGISVASAANTGPAGSRRCPPRCEALSQVLASSTIPGSEVSAHVSVANCMLEDAMNQVKLAPDQASIARMNAAVAPGLAVLDGVICAGDPYWQAIRTGRRSRSTPSATCSTAWSSAPGAAQR